MSDDLLRLTIAARRSGLDRAGLAAALRAACVLRDHKPSPFGPVADWDGTGWALRDDQPVTVRADLLRLLADFLDDAGAVKGRVGRPPFDAREVWIRKARVVTKVEALVAAGVKQEAAIAEVGGEFNLKRSKVFEYLREFKSPDNS